MRWFLAGCFVVAAASVATAEDGAEPKLLPAAAGPAPAVEPRVDYSHKGQLAVSLRLGLGLRALVPYDDNDYCGTTSEYVCTGRAPFGIDLEVAYGVAQRIDALLEVRMGIEADFGADPNDDDGPRVFHLAPGARFFFSDAKTSKLFTTAQLVLDFSGYEDGGGQGRGVDVGVRNLSGLWFDFDRGYGAYVFAGPTLTFARWMRFELEAGVGFQARFL